MQKFVFGIDLGDKILIDLDYRYRYFHDIESYYKDLDEKEALLVSKHEKNESGKYKKISLNEAFAQLSKETVSTMNTREWLLYELPEFDEDYLEKTISFKKSQMIMAFSETKNPVIAYKTTQAYIENVRQIRDMNKIEVTKRPDDLIDDIADGYRGSRAKEKQEIYEFLESQYKRLHDKTDSNWNGYNLLDIELESGVQMMLRVQSRNMQIQLSVCEESQCFTHETFSELKPKIIQKIQENKAKILSMFNQMRIEKLNFLRTYFDSIKQNEKLIKNKEILSNLNRRIIQSEQINDELEFLGETPVDFFSGIGKQLEDSNLKPHGSADYKYYNKDIYTNTPVADVYRAVLEKARTYVGKDPEEIYKTVKYEKDLAKGFKSKIAIVSTPNELNVSSSEIGQLLESIKNQDIPTLKQETTQVFKYATDFALEKGVNKVHISHHETREFENQKDRSIRYAKSLYSLITLRGIKKQIEGIDVKPANINEIKELVARYKTLAEELKQDYSGEG